MSDDVHELHPGRCVHILPANAIAGKRPCGRSVVPDSEFCRNHDPAEKKRRSAHRRTALYQAELAAKAREKLTRLVTLRPASDPKVVAAREDYIKRLELCAERTIQEHQRAVSRTEDEEEDEYDD